MRKVPGHERNSLTRRTFRRERTNEKKNLFDVEEPFCTFDDEFDKRGDLINPTINDAIQTNCISSPRTSSDRFQNDVFFIPGTLIERLTTDFRTATYILSLY